MKRILALLITIILMLSSNVIALAENTVTLEFHANGGEGVMPYVAIENGVIQVPECTMTKTYYRFDSWNTRADGSGIPLNPGDTVTVKEIALLDPSISSCLELEGKLTLYAQWVNENAEDFVKLYITYLPNGGQGQTVDFDYYLPDMTALTAFNGFTREGHSFYRWNTKPDDSGIGYGEFEEIPFTDSDIVLYAIWYDTETGIVAPPAITGLGDVDGDGSISAADALLILKAVVGKAELTEAQQTAAKTSADDAIGAEDALCILQKVVGKIDRFPTKA